MKKQPKHSFWEDAYDQCENIGESVDVLIALLNKNGEALLAQHVLSMFRPLVEAIALATPEKIRNRIGERIAAKQQAEFEAYIEKMLADMPEDADLAHEVEEEEAELRAYTEKMLAEDVNTAEV